jgi:hypothetical protein
MGDSASNIGRAGHNQCHQTVLRQLVLIMQGMWGTLVEMEPQDHIGYSNDYRLDVSGRGLGKARTRLIGDVKFKDPLSSNVAGHRAAWCLRRLRHHRARHAGGRLWPRIARRQGHCCRRG